MRRDRGFFMARHAWAGNDLDLSRIGIVLGSRVCELIGANRFSNRSTAGATPDAAIRSIRRVAPSAGCVHPVLAGIFRFACLGLVDCLAGVPNQQARRRLASIPGGTGRVEAALRFSIHGRLGIRRSSGRRRDTGAAGAGAGHTELPPRLGAVAKPAEQIAELDFGVRRYSLAWGTNLLRPAVRGSGLRMA